MSWCVLAENMTKTIRKDLYSTMLSKHIGWFDKKEHSPGQLASILATEVQTLNGVSTESVGIMAEAFVGLVTGITLGLIYQWQVALVAIAVTPLIIIGRTKGKVKMSKIVGDENDEEGNYKDANVLISDSITNYLTVASFGYQERIVDKFSKKL